MAQPIPAASCAVSESWAQSSSTPHGQRTRLPSLLRIKAIGIYCTPLPNASMGGHRESHRSFSRAHPDALQLRSHLPPAPSPELPCPLQRRSYQIQERSVCFLQRPSDPAPASAGRAFPRSMPGRIFSLPVAIHPHESS